MVMATEETAKNITENRRNLAGKYLPGFCIIGNIYLEAGADFT